MRHVRLSRIAVAMIAVGAMAIPSSASAQGAFDPVFSPLYGVQTGTYHYVGDSGTPDVFALVFSQYNNVTNQQAVVGQFFNAGAFAGILFFHDYDAATDTGHYILNGTVDPTGLAPPVPFFAWLTVTIDRVQAVLTVSFYGNIGGQPIAGTTGPVVNPLYGLGS